MFVKAVENERDVPRNVIVPGGYRLYKSGLENTLSGFVHTCTVGRRVLLLKKSAHMVGLMSSMDVV